MGIQDLVSWAKKAQYVEDLFSPLFVGYVID
jgi:hypothetical protein